MPASAWRSEALMVRNRRREVCTRSGPISNVHHMAIETSRIVVRLIPRAGVNELAGERDGVLLVRVTATPEGGRANAALCRVIAQRAGVGIRSVSIVQGARSSQKLVQVDGVIAADLAHALEAGKR